MISNRELFLKHMGQTSSSPYMLEIEKADGVFLYTSSGDKLFDLIAGVSVSNLGHGNKRIVEAVKHQAENHMHLMVYGEYIQSPQVKLAEKLNSVLPENIDSIYFLNSGSEAIETALKLAKRATRRSQIVSFKNSYHGSSHGALSITGNEDFKNSFRPLLPEVYHIEFNDCSNLELITEHTACVVIEPIQGEGGIRIADEHFMSILREKCDETGALLIFDEIQTGFGRTGKFFALEHYSIVPDIVCMAKALGAGMPLGAIAAPNELMNKFTTDPVLGHITTFGGHPVSCAAASAGIDYLLQTELISSVNKKAKLFIENLKHPEIKELRGKGLFFAVELESEDKVKKLVKEGIKEGFVTDWFIFCDNAFRIAPPLTITENEIMECIELIKSALDNI
jgi:acetylornithine/N-succinyldiaminopimelate aminotransferase